MRFMVKINRNYDLGSLCYQMRDKTTKVFLYKNVEPRYLKEMIRNIFYVHSEHDTGLFQPPD